MNVKEFEINPSLEKGFVYYALNKSNGKIYIGLTTSSLSRRKAAHICKAKNGKGLGYFHLALSKYNFEFSWGILFESTLLEELEKKEEYFISLFKSTDRTMGYNLSSGGNVPRYSEESKRKISEKAKERLSIPENNPFYGKRHTDERKKYFSDIRKGKKPNNGFEKHSEETKEKISKIRKELCKDEAVIKAMSLNNQHRIRVECVETGEIFDSLKEAAKSNKIGYSYFKKHFSKGEKINNLTFKKIEK